MRSTSRLFAAVSRSSQFLEAGAPTGLTGLKTHASPRTALLYFYSSTLEKLKDFPEHSVYRQSTEALTKHRMKIIEATKPAGLEEWQQKVEPLLKAHPKAFRKVPVSGGSDFNIVWKEGAAPAMKDGEQNPESKAPVLKMGPKTNEDVAKETKALMRYLAEASVIVPQIEAEPSLTSEQIGDIETKINSGLIEEIVEIAQAENDLAATMFENKVWKDLDEKPVEGQWTYHERDRHTAGTEAQ